MEIHALCERVGSDENLQAVFLVFCWEVCVKVCFQLVSFGVSVASVDVDDFTAKNLFKPLVKVVGCRGRFGEDDDFFCLQKF